MLRSYAVISGIGPYPYALAVTVALAAPTPAGSAAARTRPAPAPSVVTVAFSHPSDGTRSAAHAQLPAAFHAEPLSGAAQSSVQFWRTPAPPESTALRGGLSVSPPAPTSLRLTASRTLACAPAAPPAASCWAETSRGDRQLTLRPCATASAESPSRAPTICFVGGWMLHP